MKAALGFKAHSGWAALVLVGVDGGRAQVLDRRRLELVGEGETWAKAPYHAAEEMEIGRARKLVARGIGIARRNAARALREEARRAAEAGHRLSACAVLMGEPMPAWSTDEILAVHFRMHKAEGVLWREAIAGGAARCGIKVIAVAEKRLADEARSALGGTPAGVTKRLADLGRAIGPPWGKDQKDAALAALIGLGR